VVRFATTIDADSKSTDLAFRLSSNDATSLRRYTHRSPTPIFRLFTFFATTRRFTKSNSIDADSTIEDDLRPSSSDSTRGSREFASSIVRRSDPIDDSRSRCDPKRCQQDNHFLIADG